MLTRKMHIRAESCFACQISIPVQHKCFQLLPQGNIFCSEMCATDYREFQEYREKMRENRGTHTIEQVREIMEDVRKGVK